MAAAVLLLLLLCSVVVVIQRYGDTHKGNYTRQMVNVEDV